MTDVEYCFLSVYEVNVVRAVAYKRYSIADGERRRVVTLMNREYRRSILNMNNLTSALQNDGIETELLSFDGISFESQVRHMSRISALFSIHGAQLMNIVFMQPRSAVVEVFNPKFLLECYKGIAEMAQLRYTAITNTVIDPSSIPPAGSSWHPFVNVNVYVNVEQTVDLLRPLL